MIWLFLGFGALWNCIWDDGFLSLRVLLDAVIYGKFDLLGEGAEIYEVGIEILGFVGFYC